MREQEPPMYIEANKRSTMKYYINNSEYLWMNCNSFLKTNDKESNWHQGTNKNLAKKSFQDMP